MAIVATPGTCGGLHRLDGHRLTVLWVLDETERLGSAEAVAAQYDSVTADEVREALAWASAHRDEVAADRARHAALGAEAQAGAYRPSL